VARLEGLITLKGGPTVAKVWVFLVKHCGHDNALVCSLELMAEELDVAERSIRRATRYLETHGAIVIAKVGSGNVYILNDSEVWKTYEKSHRFCGFRTRTLVGFKENPGIRTRMTRISGAPPMDDLFDAAAE